jgi:hypothetical protein
MRAPMYKKSLDSHFVPGSENGKVLQWVHTALALFLLTEILQNQTQ